MKMVRPHGGLTLGRRTQTSKIVFQHLKINYASSVHSLVYIVTILLSIKYSYSFSYILNINLYVN